MTLTLSNSTGRSFLVFCLLLIITNNANGSDVSHPKLHQPDVRNLQKGGYDIVPDEYIIEFHDSVVNVTSTVEQLLTGRTGARIDHVFEHAFNGAVISGISNDHLTTILDNPMIKNAERNLQSPGERKLDTPVVTAQSNVGWNLDRLYSPYGDGQFNYSYDGTGVVVYVMGTGLRLTHEEFGGRASCAFTVTNTSCADEWGIATAHASVIGGTNIGVAKNVILKAVKVINNKGKYLSSNAYKAVEFLLKEKKNNPTTPMIVFTTQGYPYIFIRQGKKLIKAGLILVANAGDEKEWACKYTPQGAQGCITVAGTAANNSRLSDTSYGRCIDILAPGDNVTVAYFMNDTQKTRYGNSGVATAHVAGVAAMYLQKHPTWNAKQVTAALQRDAIKGAIKFSNRKYTPNLLVSTDKITNDASA